MKAGLLLRFILSAAIGAGFAVGTALLTAPPAIVSTAHSGQPLTLTSDSGPLSVDLQPANPSPLQALPASSTIQLSSYHDAAASIPPTGTDTAPWWNPTVPRVPAISQFDGGPLQAVNCTMASGAMLARLAFGIVTTGSQLRALQDDQEGATTLENLETAVENGWGVRFFKGWVTPLQLRALLYAGAGAVVIGNYGQIPVDLRLQKDFTGNHAVYVDAFRPPSATEPAAYYVMDPIGHTWSGYKGSWWPADVVERFATAYGNGLINTAWAFAGGIVPANHPVLPPSAYPSGTTVPTPGPSESLGPGSTPSLSTFDPMPPSDVPGGPDQPGGDPPPNIPRHPPVDFFTNAFTVQPDPGTCVSQPVPALCPRGVVGVISLGGLTSPTAPPLSSIKILYANALAPGMYQIIFQPPPDSTTSGLLAWDSQSGGTMEAATIDSGIVGGQTVSVATITLDPNASYSFVATASGDGTRAVSSVGTIVVGQ
jgi:hypothetical protein